MPEPPAPADMDLDQAMELVTTWSTRAASQRESGLHVLHLFLGATPDNPRGEVVIAGLAVGPGEEIARASRQLIFLHEPRVAVLSSEVWTMKPGLPNTDPDHRRVILGEIRPSQLPPHKRGEALILHGEDAAGQRRMGFYLIEPQPDGTRRISPFPLPDDVQFTSRFDGLFMVDELLREFNTNPEWLRKVPGDALKALNRLSPQRRRRLARRLIREVLLMGAGTTSLEHERSMANAKRHRIEDIMRQGPATPP